MKHGKDSRFDEIKKNPGQFSVAWYVGLLFENEAGVLMGRLGQATWITLVSLPAVLVNTIPRAAHPALGIRDLLGVGLWAGGLGLEILADSRESRSVHLSWRMSKGTRLMIREISMARREGREEAR